MNLRHDIFVTNKGNGLSPYKEAARHFRTASLIYDMGPFREVAHRQPKVPGNSHKFSECHTLLKDRHIMEARFLTAYFLSGDRKSVV